MALHLDLGRRGESLAVTFLEGLAYQILDEDRTHGKAEVEVKTRTANRLGEAEDFVDSRKPRLLADAADRYIFT